MRKIILTAMGSALVVLAISNAAGAAERRHVRNDARQQQAIGAHADPRGSFAEFGVGRAPLYGAYDSLPRGNAGAAPAGR